jgi:hypothetical protein
MTEFKDQMAMNLFGMTLTEAHAKGVCVSCRKSMDDIPTKEIDIREWGISGLCPKCFPTGEGFKVQMATGRLVK